MTLCVQVLIDEIHLLAEDRGAILESCVKHPALSYDSSVTLRVSISTD